MGSGGCASISEVVSSVSAELSVKRSLSALKAVVEGEMKLEDEEHLDAAMDGEDASNKRVCVCDINWLHTIV